jgi:hypothetical protein
MNEELRFILLKTEPDLKKKTRSNNEKRKKEEGIETKH